MHRDTQITITTERKERKQGKEAIWWENDFREERKWFPCVTWSILMSTHSNPTLQQLNSNWDLAVQWRMMLLKDKQQWYKPSSCFNKRVVVFKYILVPTAQIGIMEKATFNDGRHTETGGWRMNPTHWTFFILCQREVRKCFQWIWVKRLKKHSTQKYTVLILE